MGHMTNKDKEQYQNLQKRLDTHLMGAPFSPTLMKILTLMYSPEEARITSHVTMNFLSLHDLSKAVNIPPEELNDKMDEIARKGLVFDIEKNGTRYFTLPPVLGGLFEFVFMRVREDLPMEELAKLFEEYMLNDEETIKANFTGDTQMGRVMVREEALPAGDHVEILDWERTTKIIENTDVIGLNYCSCRHKMHHLGQDCGNPLETCFTLGPGAISNIKYGYCREVSKDEALKIIDNCKNLGLVQTADHIQQNVSFLCNCCSCCCTFFRSARTYNIHNAVVSSNWIANHNPNRCKGCGNCVKVCPSKAIHLLNETEFEKKGHWIEIEQDVCVGCGVCATVCKNNAMIMQSRQQRVYVPETIFDKAVAMAINRGKLAELIFEDPQNLGYSGLKRVIHAVEHSSPYKKMMAVESLRSVFLKTLVKIGKKIFPDAE